MSHQQPISTFLGIAAAVISFRPRIAQNPLDRGWPGEYHFLRQIRNTLVPTPRWSAVPRSGNRRMDEWCIPRPTVFLRLAW